MSAEESVGLLDALVFGKTYDSSNATVGVYGPATGINWCEPDYSWSPYVAEFWNTVSNLAFVAAGLSGRRTAQRMQLPARFFALSWTLVLLGLTSGAFHCTLLWVNQKLDETFENVALVLLFHTDKATQVLAVVHSALVAAGIFTVTVFLFCELHLIAIILATLWKVKGWVEAAELAAHGRAGLNRAVKLAAGSAVLGFACWLVDRLLCVHVLRLAFNPQLHAWWCVFLSFFHTLFLLRLLPSTSPNLTLGLGKL